MERQGQQKKKESGAEGRNRRKRVREELQKSSQVMTKFLRVPRPDGDGDNRVVSAFVPATDTASEPIERSSSSSLPPPPPQRTSSTPPPPPLTTKQTDLPDVSSQPSSSSSRQFDEHLHYDETEYAVLTKKDVGYIKFDVHCDKPKISDELRLQMVKMGAKAFQNKDGPFKVTKHQAGIQRRCAAEAMRSETSAKSVCLNRSFTNYWFQRKLQDGSAIPRNWLLYSVKNDAVYCFCCLLFSTAPVNQRTVFEKSCGFLKWKKCNKVIPEHEEGVHHRASFLAWKDFERRILEGSTIDKMTLKHMEEQKQLWKDLLRRFVDCIKFLATQQLAFRGHREVIASSDNPGNFLALVNLLSKYDPLLQRHLDYVKSHTHAVTFLSGKVQNEFIELLGNEVRQSILHRVKKSKYYGMMFDTTPDISHNEQMSQVLRFVYVDNETKTAVIKEVFIDFIKIHEKGAESIAKEITSKLELDNLDLNDCRGQTYDNAATMAGKVSGVQKLISQKNPKAKFVNCDNHSLNLVGVHAASEHVSAISFFGVLDSLYNFFSSSTMRWEKLKEAVGAAVKRSSDTRWSARRDAVHVMKEKLDDIATLLEDMASNTSASTDTRSDASCLLHNIYTFSFLTMLPFWDDILTSIDRVQKRLQSPKINFNEARADIQSLEQYITSMRDSLCENAIVKGEEKYAEWDIDVDQQRRVRRRKKMAGEKTQDEPLNVKKEMDSTLKVILDRLKTEMRDRFTRLSHLYEQLGFLLETESLIDSKEDMREKCKVAAAAYEGDFDGEELGREIADCRMLIQKRKDSAFIMPKTPIELFKFAISYGDDVFPNLQVALRILLSVAVSVASCERSFSKLKLIKNYLRSTMGQGRLSNLALLSIEKEEFELIDIDSVIDKFLNAKPGRMSRLYEL